MEFDKIPSRFAVGVMLFIVNLVNYTMRVNLSVNIVAMAPPITNATQTKGTEGLGWTSYERAVVLSAYFWGYLVSSLIAGPMSERFGPRKLMFISMSVSALLTLASPAVAKINYIYMTVLRVVLGVFSGITFPSSFTLIAHWAVPFEKGKFTSAVLCGTIGTVVTWIVCGVVVEPLGWEWGFYVFGVPALIICVPFLYYVYDSPHNHPRISPAEKQYILEGNSTHVNKVKAIPPYRSILTSVPVWAYLVLAMGNGWGIYFVITAAPMFIANVLDLKFSSTSFLSSSTYLARVSCGLISGLIGDYILKRDIVSLKMLRKGTVLFSHIIPGCLLLCLTFIESSTTAITLVIIAFGFNGTVVLSSSVNPMDLLPNFSGTLSGLGVFAATISGIVTPLVVAYFTKNDETNIEAWRPVFYIGSTVYIISGVLFLLFGSVEVQKFNKISPDEEEQSKEFVNN